MSLLKSTKSSWKECLLCERRELYSQNYVTVHFGKDFKSDFDLNAFASVPGNINVNIVGKKNVI